MPLAGWTVKNHRMTFTDAEAMATTDGSFFRFPPAALHALGKTQRKSSRLVLSPSSAGGCARKTLLQYTEEYYENPENLWQAFIGSAIHKRLETGGEHEELHLSLNVPVPVITEDGEVITVTIPLSGTLDHYDPVNRRLTDYKTTSRPFKQKMGDKWVYRELPEPTHVTQANLYRMLLEHHGYPVDSIQIWYVATAGTARQVHPVPLWDKEEAYYEAMALAAPIAEAVVTGELPPCTCKWNSKQDPDLCKSFTSETWNRGNLPPLV